MMILNENEVVDSFGEGNSITLAVTRKMYRAVTRGSDLIAWWPFDEDPLGENVVVMGKTSNSKTANLFDAEVSNYGRFGRGVRFEKDQSDARMRINDGVDIKEVHGPYLHGFGTFCRLSILGFPTLIPR